jgi:hypothetical protein
MLSNSAVTNPSNENFEKCKKVLSTRQLMPFFSIPETIIGSLNIIPWIILLIIVSIIIII